MFGEFSAKIQLYQLHHIISKTQR